MELNEPFRIGTVSSDIDILKQKLARHSIVELGADNWHDGAHCWNSGDFKRFLEFEYLQDALRAIKNGDKDKSEALFSMLKKVEKHLRGEYLRGSGRKDRFSGESKIVSELESHKWLWDKGGNRVNPREITRNELDEALYGASDHSSAIYEILGFKEDPIDAYIDGLKNLSAEQRMLVIQQIAPLQEDDDIYDPTITGERAHIKHRYNGFCQICGCKSDYWETPELFLEPKKELEQMYLSLCCNCAAEYRRYRNNDTVINSFARALVDALPGANKVNITHDRQIYFTKKHLFEIQTILKEMGYK